MQPRGAVRRGLVRRTRPSDSQITVFSLVYAAKMAANLLDIASSVPGTNNINGNYFSALAFAFGPAPGAPDCFPFFFLQIINLQELKESKMIL